MRLNDREYPQYHFERKYNVKIIGKLHELTAQNGSINSFLFIRRPENRFTRNRFVCQEYNVTELRRVFKVVRKYASV